MKLKLPTLKQIIRIFIGVFCIYTIIGFWIVPLGFKWVLRKKIGPRIQHNISVEKVSLNPYLFQLKIKNLDIHDDNHVRLVGFDQLYVDFSILNLLKRKYHFQDVELTGLYVQAIVSAEGHLNLENFIPPKNIKTQSHSSEIDKQEPQEALPSILIDALTISKGTIHVKDQRIQPAFDYVFSSININVEDLNTEINEDGKLGVTFLTNNGGIIEIVGNSKIQPPAAVLKFNLKNISVSSIQPYIQQYFKSLYLEQGLLNLSGDLNFDGDTNSAERLSINAQINLHKLYLTDTSRKESLIAWQDLELSSIHFSLTNKILNIGSIIGDELRMNLVLENEGSNIDRIFTMPLKNDRNHSDNTVKTKEQESLALNDAPQKDKKASQLDYHISVQEILLHKSQISVLDQTVTPHFKMAVTDIESKIIGFSTDNNNEMSFMLQGSTDKKDVIDFNGKGFPFKDPIDLTMEMRLNNYQMAFLTPYVGKYSGLGVDKGNMNFTAEYIIADNNLAAKHKVLIKNFDFGTKVESEYALKLPFKLILSVLQDIKGNINLNLPVSGNLTDPKFKYSHHVGKVLTNYLLKIVTKPFAFLASVISSEAGEEEFRYIYFEPGKAEITMEENRKLIIIAAALKERPLLGVDISGVTNPEVDWLAIKKTAFDKEYLLALEESRRDPVKVLSQMYQKNFGWIKQHKLYRSFIVKMQDGGESFDKIKYQDALKRQLIENMPVDKAAVKELANRRAQNVYDVLIQEGQVEDARVHKKTPKEVESSLEHIPMELTLTTNK